MKAPDGLAVYLHVTAFHQDSMAPPMARAGAAPYQPLRISFCPRGSHSAVHLRHVLQVVTTISQGKVVYEGGQLAVVAGAGRFVPMPLHPPIFEGVAQHNAQRLGEEFPYGQTPVRRRGDAAPARDEL
jgi:hypothetical protein